MYAIDEVGRPILSPPKPVDFGQLPPLFDKNGEPIIEINDKGEPVIGYDNEGKEIPAEIDGRQK